MSRIIDADELANKVADLYTEGEEATEADKVVNDVIDLINNAPTVLHDNYSMGYQDGVKKVLSERPQGEWVVDEEHSITMTFYKCTNCDYFGGATHYRYCPHCGADMRGGRK